MIDIFKNSRFNIAINFRQHVFWDSGIYTMKEVDNIQVFNPDHNLHMDFKEELLKIHGKRFVSHNFNHLLINKSKHLI